MFSEGYRGAETPDVNAKSFVLIQTTHKNAHLAQAVQVMRKQHDFTLQFKVDGQILCNLMQHSKVFLTQKHASAADTTEPINRSLLQFICLLLLGFLVDPIAFFC